jgi:uncharacterized protein YdeI (YjbR/CyaY-like superfamily)
MKNQEFDHYIEQSAEFAQPILTKLRQLIHSSSPKIEEQMKWSFPNFIYKKSILCSLAAHKQHCTFGFWLGSIMDDPEGILQRIGQTGMGQFGKIKTLNDLPSDDIIILYLQNAMDLIDKGVKLKKETTIADKKTLEIPDLLKEALNQNGKAQSTFDMFSYSNKKEYIEWINGAKTDATRKARTNSTIELLVEGKTKNWKYERKK